VKILALGGCGAMGKVAVETVLELNPMLKIVIADIDEDAAMRFADSLPANVTAAQVNALDSAQLDRLMQPCDIVVSTIGPFYLFGSAVLESAIRTGTHYMDICDDPEPTLAMLSFHQKAEEAGITAIIGAGASPGTSNLLAVTALSQLKVQKEIYTFWGTGGPIDSSEDSMDIVDNHGRPSAATIHWMEQLTGLVPVLENGQLTPKKPLAEVIIDFPGLGRDACHICGHPEPITMHQYYPSIQTSYNLMNMPSYIIYALKKATRHVRDGNQEDLKAAAEKLGDILTEKSMGVIDTVKYLYYLSKDKRRNFFPALSALAIGDDAEGNRMSVSAHLEGVMKVDDMAHSTCVPTAIILNMMTNGSIMKRGVFAPEACVDPREFFKHMAPYLHINEGFNTDTMLNVQKVMG
jgi:saccharopine dehydrogenase-like NADP-dependent oxidoreductase